MLVFFFNRRTPYVMKDFLHNESCLEKYYACWQDSLISNGIFWQAYLLFGDNLVFILHFNVIRQFWQMHFTSHVDKILILSNKKCEHQSITVFSGWYFFIFSCEVHQISETNFKSSDSYNMFKQVNKTLKGFLNFF
jgi:hypothetical protein